MCLKNKEAGLPSKPASLSCLCVTLCVLNQYVFIRLVDSHHKQMKALKLIQALMLTLIVVHQNGCYVILPK